MTSKEQFYSDLEERLFDYRENLEGENNDRAAINAEYSTLNNYVSSIVGAIEESVHWDEETGEVQWGGITKKARGINGKLDGDYREQTLSRALTTMKELELIDEVEMAENGKKVGRGRTYSWEGSNIYELRAFEELVTDEEIEERYMDF